MGCGESKHQVVANAVRNTSKRSASKPDSQTLPSAGNGDVNRQVNTEAVNENTKTDSVVTASKGDSQTLPSEKPADVNLQVNSEVVNDKPKTNSVVEEKASQVAEAEKSTSTVKEGSGDEKLKVVEEEKKNDEVVVKETEKEKEKSEELKEEKKRVEEIITEGGINSGKSDNFYSPFAKDAAVVSSDVPVQTNQTKNEEDGAKAKDEEIPKKEEKDSTATTTTLVVEEKVSTKPEEQVQVSTATKEGIATETPAEDSTTKPKE